MIPKILHQIWLGPKPRPAKYMDTWRVRHPKWQYRLWTEANIPQLINRRHFDEMGDRWHGKADILRYEILLAFGGVYADADSECVRPMDDRLLDNRIFACYENEIARPGLITNAFIGCVPGNKLIHLMILGLAAKSTVVDQPPWIATGPDFFTKVIEEVNYPYLKLLPSHLFAPRHFTGTSYKGDATPYAIHRWGTTGNTYPEPPPPGTPTSPPVYRPR